MSTNGLASSSVKKDSSQSRKLPVVCGVRRKTQLNSTASSLM